MKYIITENQIRGFERFLYQNERSRGTVEKYLRDLTSFRRFLGEQSGFLKSAWLFGKRSLYETVTPRPPSTLCSPQSTVFCVSPDGRNAASVC